MDENIVKRGAKRYGEFVARRPFTALGLVAFLLILGLAGASQLVFEASDNSDAIPEDIEVLQTFDLVNSKFPGGTESMRIAIELNSRSPELGVSDIRQPEVLGYAELLAKRVELEENVISAETITSAVKEVNGGHMPGSLESVKSTISANSIPTSSYIDPDFSILIVSLSLSEDSIEEYEELYYGVEEAINSLKRRKPAYVDAYQVGEAAVSVSLNELIGPDMGKTTSVSLIAIFTIMIILFMSLRKTIIALMAVIFGLIWAFGIAGFTGLAFNQILSSAASMILGIGIDFGIQTTGRFKQELKENGNLEEAMGTTLAGVFVPLATTTAVGTIGFFAMTAGSLKILSDLGTMMMYGIIASLFAALLVVPPLLVLNQKLTRKLKQKFKSKRRQK
jgi:hypothetical protein